MTEKMTEIGSSFENSVKQDYDSCHYSNPVDDSIERTDFYHSIGKFPSDITF